MMSSVYTEFKRLRDHKYCQCHVIATKNFDDIVFYSYNTPVIFIKKKFGKRFIKCTGTYSQTTRKQIGYFLKEYAPDLCYYDMKNIVGKLKYTIM